MHALLHLLAWQTDHKFKQKHYEKKTPNKTYKMFL